jgi:hypothetical protein
VIALTSVTSVLPGLLVGSDLPSRREAREAARRELSRHEYREAQPPWFVRLLNWVLDRLNHLLDRASSSVPGGGWGLLVICLLVALLIAVVVVRLRPTGSSPRLDALFEGAQELSAAEHRARAERAAAAGDLGEAVQERFRAVVRELESRGVLDPRPGRTADEVAREAGGVLPVLADPLRRGALLFDDVRYGGREVERPAYLVVVELDEQVVRTKLVAV